MRREDAHVSRETLDDEAPGDAVPRRSVAAGEVDRFDLDGEVLDAVLDLPPRPDGAASTRTATLPTGIPLAGAAQPEPDWDGSLDEPPGVTDPPVGVESDDPADRPWWRRPVPLGAATVAALATLALGLVGGTGQGRNDERKARLATTRVLVSLGEVNLAAGQQRVTGSLQVLSTGGPVLLSRLTTPYGDVTFRPAVQIGPDGFTAAPLDVIADCSSFDRWSSSDPRTFPTSGTALVRDRAGDDERRVNASFSPDLVQVLVLLPCSNATSLGVPDTSTPLPSDAAPSPS